MDSWDKYFFDLIEVIRAKSKDRSTKVGCVIADNKHTILATGFNGFPRKVNENSKDLNEFLPPHLKHRAVEEIESRHQRPTKYLFTEHAERNAIYQSARKGVSLEGSIIYIDWYPCADCARAIIQSGIKEVVIDARDEDEKKEYWNKRWKDHMNASKKMLKEAEVKIRKYKG